MSTEIDLSDETDPTERMVEKQERARDAAERTESAETEGRSSTAGKRSEPENHRDAEHDGEVQTDDFDITEALDCL